MFVDPDSPAKTIDQSPRHAKLCPSNADPAMAGYFFTNFLYKYVYYVCEGGIDSVHKIMQMHGGMNHVERQSGDDHRSIERAG
jgi:hypothetical protein